MERDRMISRIDPEDFGPRTKPAHPRNRMKFYGRSGTTLMGLGERSIVNDVLVASAVADAVRRLLSLSTHPEMQYPQIDEIEIQIDGTRVAVWARARHNLEKEDES